MNASAKPGSQCTQVVVFQERSELVGSKREIGHYLE